jgi:alanyl-tRNA synthetase
MTTQEILTAYLDFFKERGHALIPNLSLVPSGDSTLLFVNSGMFPLVPYLSGEPHPLGKRLINVQRSIRFEDIDEIGDNRHTTCFHMLGNWSLGDYFKEEQLRWIWEFMVERLGIDVDKMYGTVFYGDEYAPRDEVSIGLLEEIFRAYGVSNPQEGERIFAYKGNWWQRGDAVGELGGPDSEIYYYIGKDGNGLGQDPDKNEEEFIEIGNSVFMQYKRTPEGWDELPQKNVDFGGGLERITMVVQQKEDIFETDSFWPIVEYLQEVSGASYRESLETTQAMRILADHVRGCVLLAMDGVIPSNKDQGYVLRRLLRRMVRYARNLNIKTGVAADLVDVTTRMLSWMYPNLPDMNDQIKGIFVEEEEKFSKTLDRGVREAEKRLKDTDGSIESLAQIGFDLYQSLGYPPEMIVDDARDCGFTVDLKQFERIYATEFTQHKDKSRAGAEHKFKGGLADQSEQVVKYHTTTHILHWALRQVLGDNVIQHGSNITSERLRFDFNYDSKLSDEQISLVEELVNKTIKQSLPVNFVMLPIVEAEKTGAIHAFGEKYGETVKVYFIGSALDTALSKEFCGGPHVQNTSELNEVQLYKQESVGKGIRRVYLKRKN